MLHHVRRVPRFSHAALLFHTACRGKPKFCKLYRFNEGYTNAVKRPLLMRDLL